MSAIQSIFGGGKKEQSAPQITAPSVNQEPAADKEGSKKNRIRALLLGTATPEGVLDTATTARRKLLGN